MRTRYDTLILFLPINWQSCLPSCAIVHRYQGNSASVCGREMRKDACALPMARSVFTSFHKRRSKAGKDLPRSSKFRAAESSSPRKTGISCSPQCNPGPDYSTRPTVHIGYLTLLPSAGAEHKSCNKTGRARSFLVIRVRNPSERSIKSARKSLLNCFLCGCFLSLRRGLRLPLSHLRWRRELFANCPALRRN